MEPITILKPLLSLFPPISFPSSPIPNLKTLALKHIQSLSIPSSPAAAAAASTASLSSMLMSTSASAISASRDKMSPFVLTLAQNPTFVSGLAAWVVAQSIKMLLNFFVERRWDFEMLMSSGGMPSSHSALCTALTAAVGFCHGVGDSLFPVCLGFSLIVMYDAIGVRRHAGMQAEVLNKIVEDLFQGHPISQRKLKELLGHTPSQVFAGALLGILVACVCCQGGVAI